MSKSILVIDDEEVFHWITSQFLLRVDETAETVFCFNGQEGIDYLKATEKVPDIILLDLNMPIANGWFFLESFAQLGRDDLRDVLLFVVSSSIDQDDIDRAKSYPYVREYISKPITLEILQELLSL